MRFVLGALGVLLFGGLWHAGVLLTATEVRLEAFGLAIEDAHLARVVVVDRYRAIVARGSFALDDPAAAVETVRTLWGAHQPKLAALPPGDDAPVAALAAILERAKVEFGGGILVEVFDADPRATAAERAATAARRIQDAHVARRRDLPTPPEAIAALLEMSRSGILPRYIVASLFRVAFGFTFAVIVGIPFGLVLGSFAWVSAATNALLQILRPISPIAWLPVATIMFGGGDRAAVFLIFYCSFFPIAISTAAATSTVELRYRRSAMNFGIRGIAMTRRVILPAILPSLLTALRVVIGVSWLVVVAAEMLGVESGLGYLVLDARNQVRYDRVVAAMMVIGVIGLSIDATVRHVERVELRRRGFTSP